MEGLDPKPENRVFAAKFGNVPVMLRASPWLALLRAWGCCAQLGPADCRGGVAFPVRQGAVDRADEQRSRHRRTEWGCCLPLRGTEGLTRGPQPNILKLKMKRQHSQPSMQLRWRPPLLHIDHPFPIASVRDSLAFGCILENSIR